MKTFLGLVVSLLLATMIILTLQGMDAFPAFGAVDMATRVSNAYTSVEYATEVGSANIITAIVVGYRAFDTLGEVTVLFISSLGVAFIVDTVNRTRMALDYHPNFIFRVGSKYLVGIMLVTAAYIIIHGHLTPGGGFPGGAMIASAVLLLYMVDDKFRGNLIEFKTLESTAGSIFVIIGLIGLVIGGSFLENFLPAGTLGAHLSAGIIPIIYVLVGLKVGSEITGIIDTFLTEEESA